MSFSLPAIATKALAQRNASVSRWIEIEGLPYGFGSAERDASWFSTRPGEQQMRGVRSALAGIPQMLGSQIDTLNGGAMTSGSVTFNLNDIDGLITAWANIATPEGYLGADFLAASTTPDIQGLGSFTVGDLLYIGSETVEVTATSPLTVARGRFWSVAADYGTGFPVGRAPYTFANRRVRYFNIISPIGYTPTDADKFMRFQGAAKQLSLGTNRAIYDLRVDALDKEIDKQAFTGGGNISVDPVRTLLGRYSRRPSGTSYDNEEQEIFIVSSWDTGDLTAALEDFRALGIADGQYIVLKIENEYVACKAKVIVSTTTGASLSFLWMSARGLYGTAIEEHKAPLRFREVLAVTEYDADSPEYDQRASFFTYDAAMPARADHPLCILLSVLLSTGDGTNSIYDTLPARWGMGVSQELVDVTGIEAAIREDPSIRFRGHVDESTNFIAFARELLKFSGYYFFIDNSGVFTIRKLRPPLPENLLGYDAGVLDSEIIVSGRAPKWTSNWESAVQDVVFKYGWDGSDFNRVTVFTLSDARIFAKGLARTITIESKIVGPNVGGGVGGTVDTWNVDSWLLQRVDYFRTRYGKPTPLLEIAVDMRGLTISVGDVVRVTNLSTPNIYGARGISAGHGEVVAVIPEETSHTMRLMVLMVPAEFTQYRYFVPSVQLFTGHWSWDGYSECDFDIDPCLQTFTPEMTDPLNGVFNTQANQPQAPGGYGTWDLYDADWNLYMRAVDVSSNGDGTFHLSIAGSPDFVGTEILTNDMVLVPNYVAGDGDGDLWYKFAWHDFSPTPHKLYPL